MIRESGRPFEQQPADIASLRWLLEQPEVQASGADKPTQVNRSLAKLEAAALIWKHPKPRRVQAGKRLANRYRPSYGGFAHCGIAIDAISQEYT